MSAAGSADGSVSTAEPSAGARRREDAHVTRVGADVDEEVRKALAYVLRSTQARPQTEAEVRAKLVQRGVDAAAADAALEHARRVRAIDDAALARALVEEHGLRRGYGAARVRQDLERRQIPDAVIDDALTLLEDRDDEAAACDLAKRRLAQLPAGLAPEAAARRLVGYLTRRGHPPGLAERVALSVSGLDQAWN